jgi:hypothetical protein
MIDGLSKVKLKLHKTRNKKNIELMDELLNTLQPLVGTYENQRIIALIEETKCGVIKKARPPDSAMSRSRFVRNKTRNSFCFRIMEDFISEFSCFEVDEEEEKPQRHFTAQAYTPVQAKLAWFTEYSVKELLL